MSSEQADEIKMSQIEFKRVSDTLEKHGELLGSHDRDIHSIARSVSSIDKSFEKLTNLMTDMQKAQAEQLLSNERELGMSREIRDHQRTMQDQLSSLYSESKDHQYDVNLRFKPLESCKIRMDGRSVVMDWIFKGTVTFIVVAVLASVFKDQLIK